MHGGGRDDLFEFLNDFDEYSKKMLIQQIEQVGNRQENEPISKKNRKADAKDRVISNIQDTYLEGQRKNYDEAMEEIDFADELDEPGKRFRQYEIYQPPKYKVLGYNNKGKPIFKISDVFRTDDLKVRDIIEKQFNEIIFSKKAFQPQTGDLSSSDKITDFQKIIEQWEKKQYEDFTTNNRHQLNEKELEQIVINRGDQKKNYFIYKVGEKNNFTIADSVKRAKFNGQLMNPRFPQNLLKVVERKRMQYAQIQQFQSQQEESQKQMNEEEGGEDIKYWGQIKNYDPDKKKKIKRGRYLLQQKMNDQKIKEEKSLVQQILKAHRYYNPEIVNESYWKPRSQFDRIQYHLEDPNFFHTKIHTTLQKKSELLNSVERGKDSKGNNRNAKNSTLLGFGQRSRISGSLHTGNRQLSARPSNFQGGMDDGNEDHETIQQKIQRQMNHYSRKPISHSDVATQLSYLKFSTKVDEFTNFHRYEFRFDKYLPKKVKVQLLRHTKPIKNKGIDFNINIEKTDSYKKFSREDTLSLASDEQKEFILIEYIEESPLLMSDVGMCERMVLQVNYTEMLGKISQDIIMNRDIQDYEDQRDNAQNNFKNVSTEEKMELWRKNIKDVFGQNGKVYLWQPKREGKLIGNPEGYGASLMESNLGCYPIVKKQPNKRDFVLVRDENRWVLRKIDSLYVSGQVQPKRIVYTPDNRSYNTFLEKYQMDFIKKWILKSPNKKLYIDNVKTIFPCNISTAPENRLRKILKKMKSSTKDNKSYTIPLQDGPPVFLLQPEEGCLYWRMQKSLSDLHEVGIKSMKSMEKMKSILRKYFRSDKDSLDKFAIARMIKSQLQLTSWYLTESFNKFLEKKARIQMRGHADPTKGHGGYSFIKKPQKQRTDKEQIQQKQQKIKLSGTEYDLRKLKAEDSQNILRSMGYSEEDLAGKHRWDLVEMVKKEKNTEFSRKQRQTREEKEQNEKRQRSKLFNELLKLLNGEILPEGYEYSYCKYLYLEDYKESERNNWKNCLEIYEKRLRENENDIDDDLDDEDS